MSGHTKCTWCGKYGAEQIKDPVAYNNHKGFRISEEAFCSLRCIEEYQDKYLIRWIEPRFLTEKKKKCFIATAVYGDQDHPTVVELRSYRDNWLVRRSWGQQFIEKYYSYSPPIANFIEKSKILRATTFILLVKPLHILVTFLGLHKEK